LIVVSVAYLLVAVLLALNIGHRHMLAVLPFAFVMIANVAGEQGALRRPTRQWRWAVLAILAAWYVVGTLAMSPHHLTYFNELAGGPDEGYRYLADSSVDWGQGFKALKRYLDDQSVSEVRLAAFASIDPHLYGLRFKPIPPTIGAPPVLNARFNPEPGRYVISAVPLQGVWVLDPDTYDWFRHREPVARVGHALFVYDVPPLDPKPRWVAQCATPLPPLDAEQVSIGFGRSDLRLATFDCEKSWFYPIGEAGWTVLPGNGDLSPWASERLNEAPLSFRQGEFWDHSAVAIYQQQGIPSGALPSQTQARAAPSNWLLTKAVVEGIELTAPVSAVGPLTFLGYQVLTRSGDLELHTFWRVEQTSTRPLSLMAHLLTLDDTLVAVGDGLGVPVIEWQPGDVIVQRHPLVISPDSPPGPFWLQTGVYWLDTMERMPFQVAGQQVGDRLLLTQVKP
jgi:hypothetical protein